jgi:hypothetical protein
MLDGWEPQPSPCCAVASVAGAFNIIQQCDRKSNERATIPEVASLLASHCEKRAAKQRESFERLLGAAAGTLLPILGAAEELLEQHGFKWSAVRGQVNEITIHVFMVALLDVLERMPNSDSKGHAARTALKAVLTQACDRARNSSPCVRNRADNADNNIIQESLSAGCHVGSQPSKDYATPRCCLPRPGSAQASARRQHSSKQSALMIRELQKLLSKRCAVRHLSSERPRTTEIGSWGIAQASKDLFASRGCEGLVVEILLGKRSAGEKAAKIPVQSCDDDVVVDCQWEGLKAAFATKQSVLLFHLRNHYALIFAWREWHECAVDGLPAMECEQPPKLHRQILTARRGQRPSAWLDFAEVRETILSWKGYQVMQVCLAEHKNSADLVILGGDESDDEDESHPQA